MTLREGCVEVCPGCKHRNFSYKESLQQKKEFLLKTLKPWGDVLENIHSVSEKERWGYRQRVVLRVEESESKFKIGLMRRDEVVDISTCPIHSSEVNRVIQWVKEHFPLNQKLYFVSIQGSLLTFILKQKLPANLIFWENWIKSCESTLPSTIKGVYLDFHPSAGGRVFSRSGFRHLWGDKNTIQCFGDDSFELGPKGFTQLLPSLYLDSVERAKEFLILKKVNQVFDLYCGVGFTLSVWKKNNLSFLGVELSSDTVKSAQQKFGCEFVLQGKCEDRLNVLSDRLQNMTAIYANPPRLGLESKVREWIKKNKKSINRIAILSCSAGTLGRDLEDLCKSGYRVKSLIPYDFFPNTQHIEVLAFLETTLFD